MVFFLLVAGATNREGAAAAENIMKHIDRISRAAELYRTGRLEPYGVNGRQNIYIQAICRHPGISQDELARKLLVNKSNVARKAALLEANGFITRQTSGADKRRLELYPTQKARDLLPAIDEAVGQWNDIVCEGLGDTEREQLLALLKRLSLKAAQAAEGGDRPA